MRRRRVRTIASAFALVLAISTVAALAYWTATGTGTATAITGGLDAAAIAVPSLAFNSVTVTWTQQATLQPATDNAAITYAVQRRLDGGSWATIASGGCAGVKAHGVTSCADTLTTAGTYGYRTVGAFRTWTATSSEASVAVTIDSLAPTVSSQLTPAANGAGWNNTSPVAVALSAADGAGSGVADIRYTTDGSDPTSSGTASIYASPIAIAATATVKYFATDAVGNASGIASRLVQIDTTAPGAATLAFSGLSNTFAVGTTLYYRSTAASGAFTVTAGATDANSAIASYAFPSLPAGWSANAGALGVNAYSWSSANPTAPAGAQNVTATNNAGLTSTATPFTVTSDITSPTGTLTYTDGYYTSLSVSVGFTSADAGAGVNSATRVLQRKEATLTTGACGSFGSFATVGGTNPTTPYVDTGVANAKCYMYQYLVSDNLGNLATITSANVAKVDTTPASAPTGTVAVTSGGPVWGSSPACGVAGTRYVNAAGQASVAMNVAIPAAEAGESVVFAAGAVTVTVPVATGATSASTSLNLSSLGDGPVTVTARTQDVAGNLSATVTTSNAIVKDTVAAAPTGLSYGEGALFLTPDRISGNSECGATITAVETAPVSDSFTVGPLSGTTFTINVDAVSILTAYSYNVSAVDRAGNASSIVVVSGVDAL